MHGAHAFLLALTVVLCVAAVTTVLFQRLRQPVVLGYILAGLIVGPHVPIPLIADREIVQTLSELGVILLMFALGLEFRLRKLASVGPTAGVTAVVQSSIMVWLGFVVGRAFGWTTLESVFAGAIVAMSSTTIIAKAFDELRVGGPLRDLVVGVLLVEDLFAILFMAVLTAVATGAGLSPGELGSTLGRLGAFLAALLAVGMLVVPRGIRYVARRGSPETLLITSLGLCFGIAYLALASGYSVALGAFIAGSLIAESGEAHAVEDLVRPVRDLFAAVFFVSVGMLIDPALVARHWGAILVFIGLVVLGKSLAVTLGAFLTGHGVRTSVQAGMSLAQIGEFSFILAALGASLGATRDFLYPVAVAVSAATTLTTPWLIGGSGRAAAWVDRKLPPRIQTVVSLYGSWLEQLGGSPIRPTLGARVRRIVRALLVDAAAITAIIIGGSVAA
jgi:monovalent cation:H+ antiporter-2, CPA2 family